MTTIDCPLCGDTFGSENAVRDHTWDVHRGCSYCGDQFDDRDALHTHWLGDHETELSHEARKRAETNVGDRTVCPICSERFGSESTVRDHAWEMHDACHYCGDQFEDDATVHAHWLAVHDDDLRRTDRTRAMEQIGTLSFRERLTHQGPVGALRGTRLDRRTLLGGGAVGLLALSGGALLDDVFGSDRSGRGSGSSLDTHPAATALGNQPTLGPAPTDAAGTIIAFEDPSCPSCARFELDTFPRLESQLVDTGRVSFVFRGIPVVQPWGEPAVLALEATYARDEDAFWALKQFYYRTQDQLGDQNVRAKTRQFLADQTDVEASAVMTDVDRATHRDVVDTDRRAARNAGVRGTPTFFLFQKGAYVTEIVGPQSYDVFKHSLGV